MKYFLIIAIFILLGCSINYEDKLNKADKIINENKVLEAIELLKKIASSNIEEYSPIAINKLGIIYRQHKLKEIDYIESQKLAQNYFYSIYKKFPNSKDAPKSLFISAYILSNELSQFEEASEQYNLFITKYSDDQLVESAKIELKYLGLTPEEILKKKKFSNDN